MQARHTCMVLFAVCCLLFAFFLTPSPHADRHLSTGLCLCLCLLCKPGANASNESKTAHQRTVPFAPMLSELPCVAGKRHQCVCHRGVLRVSSSGICSDGSDIVICSSV